MFMSDWNCHSASLPSTDRLMSMSDWHCDQSEGPVRVLGASVLPGPSPGGVHVGLPLGRTWRCRVQHTARAARKHKTHSSSRNSATDSRLAPMNSPIWPPIVPEKHTHRPSSWPPSVPEEDAPPVKLTAQCAWRRRTARQVDRPVCLKKTHRPSSWPPSVPEEDAPPVKLTAQCAWRRHYSSSWPPSVPEKHTPPVKLTVQCAWKTHTARQVDRPVCLKKTHISRQTDRPVCLKNTHRPSSWPPSVPEEDTHFPSNWPPSVPEKHTARLVDRPACLTNTCDRLVYLTNTQILTA